MFGVLEPVREQSALEAAATEVTSKDAEIKRLQRVVADVRGDTALRLDVVREEAAAEANRFSAVNRDLQLQLGDEKKITDGVLSARQVGTVAAVAEQGAGKAAGTAEVLEQVALQGELNWNSVEAWKEITAGVQPTKQVGTVAAAVETAAAVKAAEAATTVEKAAAVKADEAAVALKAAASAETAAAVKAAASADTAATMKAAASADTAAVVETAEAAAAAEEAAAVKAAASTETAAAVKAAETAAAVKVAASTETAATVEAAVRTADIVAAVKAAEAAASVRMATTVEAPVQAAETTGAVEMAAAMEAAVETAEAAAPSVEQKQMEELQITHKGRSERAVALKEAIEAMTSIQSKKELESRGMCSDGRAPHMQLRLGLELADRCQPDSVGSHFVAAAAVTATMSAMQKQLQPQLQSVRGWVEIAESTASRLLGGDTDEFGEVLTEVPIALDEAETIVNGLAQEPDEVGECAVISKKRLEQSLTAADFQQVGVSKSERARLTDTYFELRGSERETMIGAYFDEYGLMVSVVQQLQAQVCDLSQQVGTAKGRRCRDVILEKRLTKMKELQYMRY